MSTPHDDRLRDADRPVGGADAPRATERDHGALPDDRGERIVDRSETVASAPTAERVPDRRETERTAAPRTATTERPGTDHRSTEPQGTGQPGTGQHGTVAPEPVKPGGSRTAGIWIALILGAIVLVLLLIFVIQNSASTQFEYFGATFQLPLGVAMLLAAIAGALVMALVGSVRIIQMSWEMRRLRKNQKAFRNLVQGD